MPGVLVDPLVPQCTHHVFLSHCAEDRDGLVVRVHQVLTRRGVIPWLDRHDYPYGRGSRAALRDSILACRHAAFLVTDAMLSQARVVRAGVGLGGVAPG